jgi:mannose-6-phosphate isomerase-like protein (cupin superfamily)
MLDEITRATVRRSEAGEVLDVFGAPIILRSDPARDGVFIAEHPVPPGYMVPPHIHADDDEFFYLLEGRLTLLGPDGETHAEPGDLVTLPRGSLHGFRNDTGETVRFLVICRPGVQAAEMFRHFDRAGRASADGLTPADIVAIAGQYGVSFG